MITNIFPPVDSLKNRIINLILTDELTVKEIKSELKKRFSKNYTYQGINKILVALKEEGVVLKESQKWTCCKKWASRVSEKLDLDVAPSSISSKTFKSPGKAWTYFVQNMVDSNAEGKKLIAHVKNLGYFTPEKAEIGLMKDFCKKNECVILVENKTLINRYLAKILRGFGIKIHLGVVHTTPHSTIVYEDKVVFIYYTNNDLVKHFKNLYPKIKSLGSSKAINLMQTLGDDSRFHLKMVFNEDTEVAKITREYLLELI